MSKVIEYIVIFGFIAPCTIFLIMGTWIMIAMSIYEGYKLLFG